MHVKQPVKKYFKKNKHSSGMRTNHHLTIAKPDPPWGLANQLIMLLVDYFLSGSLFEQMFLIISNYVFDTSTS